MQQSDRFDIELNYLPYRFRLRSNTNPKKQESLYSLGSYSRGKEKYNPERYIESIRKTNTEQNESPIKKLNERERGIINTVQQQNSIAYNNRSSLQKRHQQCKYLQKNDLNNKKQEPFDQIQPLQLEQSPNKSDLHIVSQPSLVSNKQEKHKAQASGKTQTQMNSIFNQSDLEQIKDNIYNNIYHQNEKQTIQQCFNQLRVPKRKEERDEEQQANYQSVELVKRFDRLKNHNKQSQQKYEVIRGIKFRKMKEKQSGTVSNLQNIMNKAQILKPQKPHLLQKFKQIVGNQYQKQSKPKAGKIQKNQMTPTKNIFNNIQQQSSMQSPIQVRKQFLSKPKQNQNQNCASPNQYTPEQHQNIKEQKNLRHQGQFFPKSGKKLKAVRKQQMKNQQLSPSLLQKFTIKGQNQVIRALKIEKSREKQQLYKCQPNSKSVSSKQEGYSHSITSSGYGSKFIKKNQSYSINMKKKKEKLPTKQAIKIQSSQRQIVFPNHNIANKNEQVKQQQIQQDYSEYQSNSNKFRTQQQALINPSPKLHTSEHQSVHNQPIRQDINDLEKNEIINDIPSHPTSRVHKNYFDQNSSILKSQDGDQLLKLMAISNDFKQISSLIISEKPPQNLNKYLEQMSRQLCQIINSNQSEYSASPTPQNISNSSSIHYNFQDNNGGFDLKEALARQEFADSNIQYVQQINDNSDIFIPPPQIIVAAADDDNWNKINLQIFNQQDIINEQDINSKSMRQDLTRRSNKAQIDQKSIRQYRGHFHPRDAIRRFKHAKHNSADYQQKSLKSARINHSLTALKTNPLNFEAGERKKSRNEKNLSRFKTRLTDS